ARRPGVLRRAQGRLPGRHRQRRAQAAGAGDHPRTGPGQARHLRRRRRLPQLVGRGRHRHRHPHRRHPGRQAARAGGRRHRPRLRPGDGVGGDAEQGQGAVPGGGAGGGGAPVVQHHAPPSAFRPDIEGLRAVAIIMVLLYHLKLSDVSGGFAGVDVFFVISGFLITGLLLKEIERTGTVSLVGFYAKRAKRLLPAAALVLIATVVGAYFVLPVTRWQETAGDIFAAAVYVINWRLAFRSVDYL